MFMHKSKKGFTIVELVIVIAVIAILAAVLIPTFSNLVKKANIANDTALAKNINTALTAYKATNAGDMEFEDVIAAARDAGYIISNLNPTTAGHYFVWEKSTNQILLVDGENAYKVIYANNEKYAPIGASWYFATSDKTAAAALKADNAINGAQVKDMVANVEDLVAAITAGGTQTLYMDESVMLDDDNIINLNTEGATLTLDLGTSSLNTNGILTDKNPIEVSAGTLNLKNGVIGAAGSYVDDDGKVVNTPISVNAGGSVNVDGTTFNVAQDGYMYLNGNNTINNATVNAKFIGIYARGNTVVENTTITSDGRIVWACNHDTDESKGFGLITFKSGTYTGGNASWAAFVTCGSFIKIEGGTYTANDGAKLFQIHDNSELARRSTIVITGGTFNGKAFADISDAEWNAMCGPKTKAVVSGDTVTICFSAQ